MAEEPGKYRGSDIGKLHNPSDDERGQRNRLPRNRDKSGFEPHEQRGDADGKRRAKHHDAAGERDGECGTNGNVHGGGDRSATFELSVAEEPGKYRGSNLSKLHDAGDDERGQWNIVPGDRDESGYERDEQCGDADGKHRPSITTQPANQTVNVGQTATFTVVATGAPPLSYQWQKNQVNIAGATSASYTTPATTSTDNGTSFRVIRNESGHERDQQCGHADGKHRSKHHDATSEPDGECGTNGDVHGGGDGNALAELSVAKEPSKYRGSDVGDLYDASDDKRRQRNILPCDRDES